MATCKHLGRCRTGALCGTAAENLAPPGSAPPSGGSGRRGLPVAQRASNYGGVMLWDRQHQQLGFERPTWLYLHLLRVFILNNKIGTFTNKLASEKVLYLSILYGNGQPCSHDPLTFAVMFSVWVLTESTTYYKTTEMRWCPSDVQSSHIHLESQYSFEHKRHPNFISNK